MWMLDVFCCALGCVTLLFLLNSRMAGDEAEKNKSALLDLDATRAKLKASLTDLDELKIKFDSETRLLSGQLAALRTEKDDLAKRLGIAQSEAKSARALLDSTQVALNAAEAKLDSTAKELATAREKAADADEMLRKRQKEADLLAKKLSDAGVTIDDLNRLIRKRDDEKYEDLDAKLVASKKDLENALASAKTAADKAADEMAMAKKKDGEELAAARGQVKELLKKVDDANAMIIDLQGQKQKLADKYDKFQKDTEARFAGIVTSGRRVVFLVDISGSMSKKDTDTADPTKWPLVVETVAKVMRSIPELEKYQVVIFSSSAKWLFGSGEWQDFVGQQSIDRVTTELLKVKPYDDTNLYAGLELAFKLRNPGGLDAVYVFSDGLPTSGPGLTRAEETRKPPLSEQELGEKLGKHVRRTLIGDWNAPLLGKPRVKIHAIGFYFDSPDVGAFLWALARENDGTFVGMSKP
jgi:hypothetical protein